MVEFVHPAELEKLMGLSDSDGLGVKASPAKRTEMEEVVDKTVRYSVRTTNRQFYNQVRKK